MIYYLYLAFQEKGGLLTAFHISTIYRDISKRYIQLNFEECQLNNTLVSLQYDSSDMLQQSDLPASR